MRKLWSEKFGVRVLEGYGATETSPGVTVNTPDDNRPGSIGKPLPSVQVRIVDLDTGKGQYLFGIDDKEARLKMQARKSDVY